MSSTCALDVKHTFRMFTSLFKEFTQQAWILYLKNEGTYEK